MGASVWAAAAAGEVCAPLLLLLCGLCCWPDDSSDSSSTGKAGKHPQKPVVSQGWSSRLSSIRSSARAAGSACDLPRAGPSGEYTLSAHRSHEELARRRSQPADQRYHSAPSVIHQVLHRRDWERSSKELYIPLHGERSLSPHSDSPSPSPPPSPPPSPHHLAPHTPTPACKKHYTNIKSSRSKPDKEAIQDEYKDTDATENISMTNFYIGDERSETMLARDVIDTKMDHEKVRSVYKAKEAKQTFNESIKSKERPAIDVEDWTRGVDRVDGVDRENGVDGTDGVEEVDEVGALDGVDVDRSGAHHHSAQSPHRTCHSRSAPPPSAETVGYEGGACYLTGPAWRALRGLEPGAPGPAGTGPGGRARHASDGDILAHTIRPESGAFSESDLEAELELEAPPPYDTLRRETAI